MVKRLSRIVPGRREESPPSSTSCLASFSPFHLGCSARCSIPEPRGSSCPLAFCYPAFLYAALGFLFVPLFCWLYNLAARLVGGLEFSVEDRAET